MIYYFQNLDKRLQTYRIPTAILLPQLRLLFSCMPQPQRTLSRTKAQLSLQNKDRSYLSDWRDLDSTIPIAQTLIRRARRNPFSLALFNGNVFEERSLRMYWRSALRDWK